MSRHGIAGQEGIASNGWPGIPAKQVEGNTAGLQDSPHGIASEIASLDRDLQQLQAELKDIDQHVANLDRKTGPAPPARIT